MTEELEKLIKLEPKQYEFIWSDINVGRKDLKDRFNGIMIIREDREKLLNIGAGDVSEAIARRFRKLDLGPLNPEVFDKILEVQVKKAGHVLMPEDRAAWERLVEGDGIKSVRDIFSFVAALPEAQQQRLTESLEIFKKGLPAPMAARKPLVLK
jgi:hypothetical protein